MKSVILIAMILMSLLIGCRNLQPEATLIHQPKDSTEFAAAATVYESKNESRNLLTFDGMINGFKFNSPVDEAAVAMPSGASRPVHVFEGRLELKSEAAQGDVQVLRGEIESEWAHIPEFDFAFVQSDTYLIPEKRGSIITDHPYWNYILEPGRVWQEENDHGYSRASFPFALVVKGGNATFNGTMTFLFNDDKVSNVWYQITQETTSFTRANFWGLLQAEYHLETVPNSSTIIEDFDLEIKGRFPTKSIELLAQDYPEVDLSAFGRGVTPEHMTWYGFVIDGINYLGGCQTRFGIYPYCESMRATSYSTAKSAFASVALMRLMQKYGPEVAELRIQDYVPEAAESPGNWDQVTFNHTLDMATGNYSSPGFHVDEDSPQMNAFFEAQPYANRIKHAFDWPHSSDPGKRWVYRTSDTFIVTRAMQNYLITQEGPDSDIFEFVVEEVYRPLGIGPGFFSTMRTADNGWQGQAEGGFGLWWIPDDITKISSFLLSANGQIKGDQVLQPDMLSASLQRNPDDRGVRIDPQRMYNNGFWANRYMEANGYDCDFWVVQMLGVSGNVIALIPNGTIYYYFSDNQEFTWDSAVQESNKLLPICP
jgi:hypothetical protein